MERDRITVYGNEKKQMEQKETDNEVLYLVDTGCKWRQLPHDFPPYSTVHSFYRRARINGLWNKISKYVVKSRTQGEPDLRDN